MGWEINSETVAEIAREVVLDTTIRNLTKEEYADFFKKYTGNRLGWPPVGESDIHNLTNGLVELFIKKLKFDGVFAWEQMKTLRYYPNTNKHPLASTLLQRVLSRYELAKRDANLTKLSS